MLRAFNLEWRPGSISTQSLVEKLSAPAALGASVMLLSRAQTADGLAPFALAFFTAALARNWKNILAVLMLLAGALTAAFTSAGFQTTAILSTAVAFTGAAVIHFAGRYLQRPGAATTALSVLAGLSVLAAGAATAAESARQSLRILLTAVAASAGEPFFQAFLDVRPTRRYLMPEERSGWLLFLAAALSGLYAVWPPLAVTTAWCGILTVAPLGAGYAAAAGLGAGAALLLSGALPAQTAAFGLCGLLTGLASPRHRWQHAAAMTLSSAATVLLLNTSYIDVLCALAAGALLLAAPERLLKRARMWISGEQLGACDPDRLAIRLRAESGRRLRALSAAFGEMADSYRLPVDVPDEQTLIADMRSQLCENCSNYAECWAGDDNRAVRFLCQLISASIEWANDDPGEPLFGEEMPPDVLRICRRGRTVPARLGVLLEEFAKKRRSELKRGAMNQLISAQFMQAQLLLCGLADRQSEPVRIRGRQAARARAALDRADIDVRDVMALRGARQMEIVATLKQGRWNPQLAANASLQLSKVFGRNYVPGEGMGSPEMKFVRQAQMRVATATASRARTKGVECGDHALVRPLEGDRVLLMLSDGMGSGEDAARESAQTARLLSEFLAADVPEELALETVNELMLARSDADMFATVDCCIVDLNTGEAEFSKLAACKSVIVRKGELMEIEGGRLPLGILEKVQPERRKVQLMAGDVIVMATDGVMDGVEEETLWACLRRHAHQPPQMLADRILEEVEKARYPDDATILTARLAPTPKPQRDSQGINPLSRVPRDRVPRPPEAKEVSKGDHPLWQGS